MSNGNNAQLTVLMTAYNAGHYISEAISSILAQTIPDFKLIVIDDGSTDETVTRIESFKDARIEPYFFSKNYGKVHALNFGLEKVDSEFLAFMDADDISFPNRFEVQLEYFEKNSGVDVLGSFVDVFGEQTAKWKYRVEHNSIIASMVFQNPLAHSSVMLRTRILKSNLLKFRSDFHGVFEDYDLWYRLRNKAIFANIDKTLVRYRKTSTGMMTLRKEDFHLAASNFFVYLLNDLGLFPSVKELRLHLDLHDPAYPRKLKKPHLYREWLDKLKTTNKITYAFPKKEFDEVVDQRWKYLFRYFLAGKKSKKIAEYLHLNGKTDAQIGFFIIKQRVKEFLGLNGTKSLSVNKL